MKQFLQFLAVAIFSIFVGSQITEGALLVPYWQSLSSSEFYAYYKEFGPSIGRYYTVLTILAALIPIITSIYSKANNSKSLKYAVISSFFAVLFVSSFYIYFKGTNELFYQATMSDVELKNELVIWSYWNWGRIVLECLSLLFLILALTKIRDSETKLI